MPRVTRPLALILFVLVVVAIAGRSQATQQGAAPDLLPLSQAVLAKLPADWRELATHIKATDAEQQRFLKLSDVVFRQTVGRLLTRIRPAEAFIRTQISADPSPAVRIGAGAGHCCRRAMERDAGNGLVDRECRLARSRPGRVAHGARALRRRRMRELNTLLDERLSPRSRPRRRCGDDRQAQRGSGAVVRPRTGDDAAGVPAHAAAGVLGEARGCAGACPGLRRLRQRIAGTERGRVDDCRLSREAASSTWRSRSATTSTASAWRVPPIRAGRPGSRISTPRSALRSIAALGNHDWGHPDSPAAEVLYSGKSRPGGCRRRTTLSPRARCSSSPSTPRASPSRSSSATGSIARSARARRAGRWSTAIIRSIRTATTRIGLI